MKEITRQTIALITSMMLTAGSRKLLGAGTSAAAKLRRGSAKAQDTAHFRICPSEHSAGDEEPCHIQHNSRHCSATDDTKQRTDIERDE